MLIGITLLSLIYAFLVRWRQNLWPAIAAHALFDGVQLLVVVPAALRLLQGGAGKAAASAAPLVDSARGSRRCPRSTASISPSGAGSRTSSWSRWCCGTACSGWAWTRTPGTGSDLAVREAVANAIKHGNAQDPGKQVHVDLAVEGDDVVIRVEDEGMGFDPAQVGDPLAPGEPAEAERPRHLLHEEASWTRSNTAPAPAAAPW